jgi:hypothetical protein
MYRAKGTAASSKERAKPVFGARDAWRPLGPHCPSETACLVSTGLGTGFKPSTRTIEDELDLHSGADSFGPKLSIHCGSA